ncbi:MAG: hypothetical protein D3923_03395 [Candidatus Electrothrix sp. AR3]|nr:hypothetical protein [Candidatus Electrothrix sp. AR3]
MTEWYQVRFRLTGNLHVGSGRWGFVLPCRPYLPGWTLWGALVVLLKQNGRWPGGYGELGRAVNEQCWLGHLFLEHGDGSRYLPSIAQARGGKTVFTWWQQEDGKSVAHPAPTLFRHGVVRSSEQDQESLGRLFLTENVQNHTNGPYQLVGIFRFAGREKDLPLEQGDCLRVGGNRQVSGAEITCLAVEPIPAPLGNDTFLGYQHLCCEPANNNLSLSGEVERIVLRRTRNTDGEKSEGFGQHFIDWGSHLVPGWEAYGKIKYAPNYDEKNGFCHGTLRCLGV